MKRIVLLLILLSVVVFQGCATATLYYPDGKIHKRAVGLFKASIE
jgi:hypothetical protein